MKRGTSLILFLTILLLKSVYGQSHYYIRLLDEANMEFSKGNYRLADSLYTICIDRSTNGDIFYNRAHARLLMNDSIGYCADLEDAAVVWNDKEAQKLFNSDCYTWVDTIFYSNSKEELIRGQKYRYYQITGKHKFDNETIFHYHDTKNSHWYNVVSTKNRLIFLPKPIESTYIARGYIDSIGKVFYYIDGYDLSSIIKDFFGTHLKRSASYLSKKYPQLWYGDKRKVMLEIQMDTKGTITNADVIQDEYFNESFAEFINFCEDVGKTYTVLKGLQPATFWGQAVRVRMYVYFEIFN